MSEVRADELRRGDRVRVGGQEYEVTRAKRKGKAVDLTLSGRRGSFEGSVKAKARYDRLDGPGPRTKIRRDDTVQRAGSAQAARGGVQAVPGPLHDSTGAQNRWATLTDFDEPKQGETTDWSAIPVGERSVIEDLGAKLLGVEVEGGKLVVPPVTDGTVLGHLVTMHGVRFDGATFAEAKAYAKEHPESTETADQVLDALTMTNAYALHESLHAGHDLAAMLTPHWHRDRAPA